jgi:IclR family mhp operon transcriptional activator
MQSNQPYRPIRALNRGLVVLQALNRLGAARPAELAKLTALDRTTTYRILATLEQVGLVTQHKSSDAFILTEQVRTLSDGFTERDRTTQIVSGHLGTLFHKVLWPTDFATFERGAMVIRETTHRFSPYSVHRAMVGKPRPLFTSALGRAALAGASPQDRATMLQIVRGTEQASEGASDWIEERVEHILADYARRGYSWSVGGTEQNISAIGVAVRMGGGAAAAINLVFFSSAMSVETAAERYLDALRECAQGIEASLGDERDHERITPSP